MDEDHAATLQSILQQLATTKTLLDHMESHPLESCIDNLSHSESAKLQVSLAYTLASLYYVLMKATGKDITADRDISSEISRIKQYVVKLNTQANSRKTTLNVPGTKRTIAHHLS